MLLLTSCTAAPPDDTSTVAAPAPAPTGEVVLTVEVGDAPVDWDLAGLRSLPQRAATVDEPFLTEQRTLRGPLWADVLAASGVPADAGELRLLALDGYTVELPTDRAALDGAILALEDGGEPIGLADGGPVRIVFPDSSRLGDNPNLWIWSLRRAGTP